MQPTDRVAAYAKMLGGRCRPSGMKEMYCGEIMGLEVKGLVTDANVCSVLTVTKHMAHAALAEQQDDS